MNPGILLDTSVLVHLDDKTESLHMTADRYYSQAVARGVPLWLSTIALAEYQVRGELPDLWLQICRVLPFGLAHAEKAGELRARLRPDKGDRLYVSDDLKLIAQATTEEIAVILTNDKSTLAKYAKRLQAAGVSSVRIQLLSDGFDESAFSAAA